MDFYGGAPNDRGIADFRFAYLGQPETHGDLSLKFLRRTIAKERLKTPLLDRVGGRSCQLGITLDRAELFDRAVLADQRQQDHWTLNMLLAR
jgi:hypothetical protein